ncbi:hypothetical protein, partial [Mesorhizobium sp. M0460]|uniref:hypothetical protein n=1 Tax=Mesorhizobium sp. M0460 TaxID=2956946 RepID=UPI003336F570
RAQEARSTPSRMTSFMIAHFAELDAHNHKSGSAMLRIRHCGRLNRAEGDASTTENIFFLRKTIRRAAGEGYWTRFEGRCTDGQN